MQPCRIWRFAKNNISWVQMALLLIDSPHYACIDLEARANDCQCYRIRAVGPYTDSLPGTKKVSNILYSDLLNCRLNENSGIGGKKGRSRTHQDTVTFKIGEDRPEAIANIEDANSSGKKDSQHEYGLSYKQESSSSNSDSNSNSISDSNSDSAQSQSGGVVTSRTTELLALHQALGALLGNKETEVRVQLARCVLFVSPHNTKTEQRYTTPIVFMYVSGIHAGTFRSSFGLGLSVILTCVYFSYDSERRNWA